MLQKVQESWIKLIPAPADFSQRASRLKFPQTPGIFSTSSKTSLPETCLEMAVRTKAQLVISKVLLEGGRGEESAVATIQNAICVDNTEIHDSSKRIDFLGLGPTLFPPFLRL
ncbi:hypothetical protein KM043_006865 [Ampulex compressa]|nr:hypothetical protein KM043_006865 [Ampulex compressa]